MIDRAVASAPSAATIAGLACVFLALAGCASLPAGDVGSVDDDVVRTASRSIWGVVPQPPRRKADLRPELISGSAVAISDATLLSSCEAIGSRGRVGLVRHNKYRLARVSSRDAERRICALEVERGPLSAVAGRRSFADLEAGEPVFAFTSRTSADLDLAEGWLAGKGMTGEAFLETTLRLPSAARSVVVFDGDGNLIGLGTGTGAGFDSLVLASPVSDALAPTLALRDKAGTGLPILLASWWLPAPRDRESHPSVIFPLAVDSDNDAPNGDRSTSSVAAAPASVDAAAAAAAGPSGVGAVGSGDRTVTPSEPSGATGSRRARSGSPTTAAADVATDDGGRQGAVGGRTARDRDREATAGRGRDREAREEAGRGRGRGDDRGRGRGRGGDRDDDDDDDRGGGGDGDDGGRDDDD